MQALHSNNLKHIILSRIQTELKRIKRCQLVEGKIEKGYYSWSEWEIEPKIFGLLVQRTGHLALFFLK